MQHRPEARVALTDSPERFHQAVHDAACLLKAGQAVVLPTETVYGLAANALDPAAVAQIYRIKGRPSHNPIIVHVASEEMARDCVRRWTREAQLLCQGFWPGPLTIVLPRAKCIPDIVTAGGDTVGVRWPSHPLIQAVILQCGFPLAAPSANPSNRISPTNVSHVLRYFSKAVPLVVDGGQSQVGIESTVVDASQAPVRVLRPGMIHTTALEATVGRVAGPAEISGANTVLKSPGQLRRHYSPRARLLSMRWENEQQLLTKARGCASELTTVHVITHTNIPHAGGYGRVAVVPHDPEAFARALYAEMHQSDALGAECIIVEAPPEGPAWSAIADRLNRAAAD